MKRLGILLIAVAGVMVGNGCEEEMGEQESAMIDVRRSGDGFIDCCSNNCGEWYSMSFKHDAPAGWYWPALEKNGNIVYTGVGKYIDTPSVYHSCTLSYHYWGGLQQGEYDLTLYRCNSREDIGKPEWSTSRGGPMNITLFMFVEAACELDCCTFGGNSNGYYYAQAHINGVQATGISARITTRWGELCHECDTTFKLAHYVAAIGVRSATAYAETGYRHFRTPSGDFYGWFAAVGSYGGGQQVYTATPPFALDEGTTPKYGLELDVSSGEWSFYYEGDFLDNDTVYDTAWAGQDGETAIWSGEIYGHETDMPGTLNARCYFTDCKYHDGISWYFVNFYSALARIRSDDSEEWEIRRGTNDSSSFYIYDKKPLPYKK